MKTIEIQPSAVEMISPGDQAKAREQVELSLVAVFEMDEGEDRRKELLKAARIAARADWAGVEGVDEALKPHMGQIIDDLERWRDDQEANAEELIKTLGLMKRAGMQVDVSLRNKFGGHLFTEYSKLEDPEARMRWMVWLKTLGMRVPDEGKREENLSRGRRNWLDRNGIILLDKEGKEPERQAQAALGYARQLRELRRLGAGKGLLKVNLVVGKALVRGLEYFRKQQDGGEEEYMELYRLMFDLRQEMGEEAVPWEKLRYEYKKRHLAMMDSASYETADSFLRFVGHHHRLKEVATELEVNAVRDDDELDENDINLGHPSDSGESYKKPEAPVLDDEPAAEDAGDTDTLEDDWSELEPVKPLPAVKEKGFEMPVQVVSEPAPAGKLEPAEKPEKPHLSREAELKHTLWERRVVYDKNPKADTPEAKAYREHLGELSIDRVVEMNYAISKVWENWRKWNRYVVDSAVQEEFLEKLEEQFVHARTYLAWLLPGLRLKIRKLYQWLDGAARVPGLSHQELQEMRIKAAEALRQAAENIFEDHQTRELYLLLADELELLALRQKK